MNEEKDKLTNKLIRLHNDLQSVKAMSKAAAKDYRDQIKDLESEIKDTVEVLENM